jgi:hypothetical protein
MNVGLRTSIQGGGIVAYANLVFFNQIPSFIDPGAGLSHLDFSQDSNFIFDSVFTDFQPSPENENSLESGSDTYSTHLSPTVRLYGSDEEM